MVVVALLVRPVALWALSWSDRHAIGLLPLLQLPSLLAMPLAFLLMDLTFYYWHRANHSIPLLWRFHNIHHIDPDLDLSTAPRFHPVEIALSAGFRLAQVTLIGLPIWLYAVYELAFQAETFFHHSNVHLPIAFERTMARLFITPRIHGIHHSQVRQETNSNYGSVFTLWDRLHRTLTLAIPQRHIVIGVPAYETHNDNRLFTALMHPFRRQRPYWQGSDGHEITRGEWQRGETTVLAE
jgi:sterol desaturase/sphingolipid hydroxylase (fatty acid hydroxylase superfamily)